MVSSCGARKIVDADLFMEMESVAGEAETFDDLTSAMATAVDPTLYRNRVPASDAEH